MTARRPSPPSAEQAPASPPIVALFITCLFDTFFPRAGEAVVRVLRHFGCRVCFPTGQTCCGQPAYNSGFHADASAAARRTIEVFAPYKYIVTPSGSCAAMLTTHYPELLEDEPHYAQAAKQLAERTFEFSTFLDRVLGVAPADARLTFPHPLTYHYSCHLRPLSTPQEAEKWLTESPGIAYQPLEQLDVCCGFGGIFAVNFPHISEAMAKDKLDDIARTQCPQVICNEAGCALHLLGVARRANRPLAVKHIAELMAESLGLMEHPPQSSSR